MVLIVFVCLTCRHLISSASPVHPLLNCSSSAGALWHQRVFFFFPFFSLSLFPPPRMQSNCRRGATVHFSCDEGYELQGSKSISCLRVTDSYVGWSDDRPICRGKDRRRCMCASSLQLVPPDLQLYFHTPARWQSCGLFLLSSGVQLSPSSVRRQSLVCVIESFFTAL